MASIREAQRFHQEVLDSHAMRKSPSTGPGRCGWKVSRSTNGTLLANPYNEFNRLIFFFTSGRRRAILN